MTRQPPPPRRKKPASPNRPAASPRAPRPGVITVDPATEKEINGLFITYLKRMGLTIAIMALVAFVVVTVAQTTRNIAAPVIFLATLTGLMISYRRGIDKVFSEVQRIGMERVRSKRYADAIYALEQFHRVGNMGYDRDGEAHHYLALAYLGSGQFDKAKQIVEWLEHNRKRGPYAARAASALQQHRADTPAAPPPSDETER